MEIYAGTSGYAYKEWKGSFYPQDLPAKQMLRYYAERFQAVEINNTFYRMPTPDVLEAWAAEVPPGFQFVLKSPQVITHFKRLKEVGEPLSRFLQVAVTLKERLGPLLFQLPPNMKKDAGRLREFLASMPEERPPLAFEFRHASWFDDEILGVLREHRVALCIAEAEGGLEAPFAATTDWGYLRLRMFEYNDAQLAERLSRMRAQNWSRAFIFFKHEDEARGPDMARRFLALAGLASEETVTQRVTSKKSSALQNVPRGTRKGHSSAKAAQEKNPVVKPSKTGRTKRVATQNKKRKK